MTGRADSATSVASFPRFAPPITGLVVLETLKRTMVIICYHNVIMTSQNFHDKGVLLYTFSL